MATSAPKPSWRHDKGTSAQRGYGGKWQRERAAFLAKEENALCTYCARQDRAVESTVVDHIIPHQGDIKLFWSRSNWQALCKTCHDTTKAQEEGRAKAVRAVDAEGWPM